MKLVLVTHACPNYGASGVLSVEGRQGAQWLATECLGLLPKNAAVVSILSSPRTRCIETATIFAGKLGQQFSKNELKGERKEHGKPWDDIPATRVHVLENLDEQPTAFTTDDLQCVIEKAYEIATPQIEKLNEREEDITPVVIVALHGDLANALKIKSPFVTQDPNKNGYFFGTKPVLAILDHSPGQKLSKFNLEDPFTKANKFDAKCDPLCLGRLN